MNDDHIERRGLAGARLDHALEFGPAIIRSGSAWLDVGLNQLVAARCAVSFALPLLIGNRDIVLGLPRRRDAQIQGGAQRHGHRDCPFRSSVRPEQLIEKIAKPCLEHIEFGVGDRHRVGPIVRNQPRMVTGTGLGQSSVTSHVSRSCLGGRPVRGQGSGSM
jgi:hypothetical protein